MGDPPCTATVFSLSPAKKAISWLSGFQNAPRAPSVNGSAFASPVTSECTHTLGLLLKFGTNAR